MHSTDLLLWVATPIHQPWSEVPLPAPLWNLAPNPCCETLFLSPGQEVAISANIATFCHG